MKRKLFISLLLVFVILSFYGCSMGTKTDYPIVTTAENNSLGCIELIYNGVTYRPFGISLDTKLRGKQIGIRDDVEDGRGKVCEVKGYEVTEWLIDYLDVFMGGGDMILKAVEVKEIPSELEQYRDYDFG